MFSKYWPADLHIIGKDITRFHCLLWPAMLMSAGLELPRAIHGHGFVNFRGERMSKTLGNIVEPLDAAKRYGADALRYYLAREVAFGKDGDFSWEQFIQRYNSELANDLGNLLSRACGMLKQYFGGNIPGDGERAGGTDDGMKRVCAETRDAYFVFMDGYEIHSGIAEVFKVVRAANRYIEECAPWSLMKKEGGKAEAAKVLFTVAEVLRQTAVLLFPFMPSKAQGIWETLGIEARIADATYEEVLTWRDSWDAISDQLGDLEPLFPRIETKEEVVEKEKPVAKTGEPEAKTEDLLDIEDFKRLDLRVAHVKSAGMVPGAKKLMKLMIDIGDEERQIVAGIAGHYEPEDLTGKNIIVVTNLKPATIRGVESQGMLLAATDGDKVIVLVPDREASPGARIS
jgi:methionyl-tRNA synthetase